MLAAKWLAVRGWLDDAQLMGETGYEAVLQFRGLATRATMMERRLSRVLGRAAPDDLNALREAERRVAIIGSTLPPRQPVATLDARRAEWRQRYGER